MKKPVIIISFLLTVNLIALFYLKIDEKQSVLSAENSSIFADGKKEVKSYFKISFLDVGQGDGIYVSSPKGRDMLIDCGPDGKVLASLGKAMSFTDKTIDYLFITHPDLDHYGGCADVLRRFEVKNIVYTGLQKNDKTWQEFWRYVEEEGAKYYKIDKKQEWNFDSGEIDFLYPDHDVAENSLVPGESKASDNNTSLVFRFSYGEKSILFTGDMEMPLENYLLKEDGEKLNVDILKIGHHGSGGSSGEEFVRAVSPQYSVISVGKDNDYGHPSLRVLKRLERLNSDVLRTDKQGGVVLQVFEDDIVVK